MNANQQMTTNLLDHLSPTSVASILNANPEFVKELIGHLDPRVIATTTNSTGPFMTGLYANLDEDVIGSVVEGNTTFLTNLVANLDPSIVAGGINQASSVNPDFIPNLISHLNGQEMANTMKTIHDMQGANDFIGRVMGALYADPTAAGAIATAVNANAPELLTSTSFLGDFIGGSDPTVLADVVNMAQTYGFISPLALSLNPTTLADAMNAHPASTGALLSALNTSGGIEAITDALNANPQFLPRLLAMLSPDVLTQAAVPGDDNLFQHFALQVQAVAELKAFGLPLMWINLPTLIWTQSVTDVQPAYWPVNSP
jgi:hypothetical protein